MGRKQVPDDWTPDTPHPDLRRERFCQLVAGGTTLTNAYKRTGTGKIAESTARANSHRMAKEPALLSRVEFLRIDALGKRGEDATVFSRATMNNLMGEVTTALESAIGALEYAGGNPSTIAQLRSDLVVHVGRIHRMTQTKTPRRKRSPDHLQDGLARMKFCACFR